MRDDQSERLAKAIEKVASEVGCLTLAVLFAVAVGAYIAWKAGLPL